MRHREIIATENATIDLISEGSGPLVVLLPSKARCSEDFDDVAAGLATNGLRVLRPQPRGTHGSRGPTDRIRLEDLAVDVAHVIEREACGSAVVVGHAFGNWPARMLAVTHPHLVRGIGGAAAAARTIASDQRADVRIAGDATKPDAERLAALRRSFFAPGHDATPWLAGWHADAGRIQDIAVAATPRETYWHAGNAPILELIPELDPFKPPSAWQETTREFGTRVSVVTISGASHALIPERPSLVIDAITGWARSLAAV